MRGLPFHIHLHGLGRILSVLSGAQRVGIEICRMTGYISGAEGELRLFRTGEQT